MEFEIKDLEIIEAEQNLNSRSTDFITNNYNAATNVNNQQTVNGSAILSELSKENEDLQQKLKLNYRRLLLFETENNKLLEEKNKLFFDAQNHYQKNILLVEKIQALENENLNLDRISKLTTEKINSLEKINQTQLNEIRRFSKFHNKIQNVVKPFIVTLKKEILQLKNDLTIALKQNANLTNSYREYSKKIDLDLNKKTNEILSLETEKNSLVKTYEEQIHVFSKEIIELQTKNEDLTKEIIRLKKSVEFKNYFENEVIRLKRNLEEGQSKINELSSKKASQDTKVISLEEALTQNKNKLAEMETANVDYENSLNLTREQLSKKIDEIASLNERMSRLEKLNNQLSLELSQRS